MSRKKLNGPEVTVPARIPTHRLAVSVAGFLVPLGVGKDHSLLTPMRSKAFTYHVAYIFGNNSLTPYVPRKTFVVFVVVGVITRCRKKTV